MCTSGTRSFYRAWLSCVTARPWASKNARTSTMRHTGCEFRKLLSFLQLGKGSGLGSTHSLYVPFRRLPEDRKISGSIILHVCARLNGHPILLRPCQSTISRFSVDISTLRFGASRCYWVRPLVASGVLSAVTKSSRGEIPTSQPRRAFPPGNRGAGRRRRCRRASPRRGSGASQ